MLGMCTFLTTLHWQTKDTEYKHPWSYHSLCHEEARRSCMFLELPIHFPYSFPDHLERQWWLTLAHSVLPCAETGCVFQPDFSMLHWISVNIFFFFFNEPDKHWEQFRIMLKEIYSQSAYRMPGSPIYFSHSQVPSLHLIPIPWGHVSQKYWSSVAWTILQRKSWKISLSMIFILLMFLSVINCSFLLSVALI